MISTIREKPAPGYVVHAYCWVLLDRIIGTDLIRTNLSIFVEAVKKRWTERICIKEQLYPCYYKEAANPEFIRLQKQLGCINAVGNPSSCARNRGDYTKGDANHKLSTIDTGICILLEFMLLPCKLLILLYRSELMIPFWMEVARQLLAEILCDIRIQHLAKTVACWWIGYL